MILVVVLVRLDKIFCIRWPAKEFFFLAIFYIDTLILS